MQETSNVFALTTLNFKVYHLNKLPSAESVVEIKHQICKDNFIVFSNLTYVYVNLNYC